MAAYRKISVTFWSDSFVQGLTPESKYFYLYLMTNTRTTQCGIYEITISQICFETGYNQDTVSKLLEQFEVSGKIKYSKTTNEIALKNWPKYNESTSPKVTACVENELKSVKNRVLILYLYSMDTLSQETKTKTKEEAKEESPFFDDFWNKYGKKVDRIKCEKKWSGLSQKVKEKIMSHLDRYVLSTPDVKFRRDPATYLNNQSWENEIPFVSESKRYASPV